MAAGFPISSSALPSRNFTSTRVASIAGGGHAFALFAGCPSISRNSLGAVKQPKMRSRVSASTALQKAAHAGPSTQRSMADIGCGSAGNRALYLRFRSLT
jgi:hypothetical protein